MDHINNNRLNNNVCNLGWATRSENNFNNSISKRNTSGIKGVSYDKRDKKWRAKIQINGKEKHLGYYNSLEEAKTVRQQKAKELFGEYLNSCEKS